MSILRLRPSLLTKPKKEDPSGNDLQTLLSAFGAAAIAAGGTGLANWGIWCGDAVSGTTLLNQGGLGGDATGRGNPAFTPFLGRQAMDCDGATDWLVAASSDFDSQTLETYVVFGSTNFTAANACTIFNHGYSVQAFAHRLFINASSDLAFLSRTSGGGAVFTTWTGFTGGTYHAATELIAPNTELFVDGLSRATQTTSTATLTGHLGLTIGSKGAANYWEDAIAFIAVTTLNVSPSRSTLLGELENYYPGLS